MDPQRLVAHRGYAARFTENSLDALRAAMEAGALFVETDIQLTADKVPVLFHDRDLKRLCGVGGAIHDYAQAELPPFSGEPAQPIATLQQLVMLLQKFPAVQAFIELKRLSIETFGADTVLELVLPVLRPVRERAILISFDYDILHRARGRGWPRVGAVLNAWRDRTSRAVLRLRPDFVFADVDDLPRFRRLEAGNAVLVIYEVEDLRLATQLLGRGADMIETFDVVRLMGSEKPRQR